jgi:hypothetical protein
MSPTLQTKVPGIGSADTHFPDAFFTFRSIGQPITAFGSIGQPITAFKSMCGCGSRDRGCGFTVNVQLKGVDVVLLVNRQRVWIHSWRMWIHRQRVWIHRMCLLST